jgi:hypothetical protein
MDQSGAQDCPKVGRLIGHDRYALSRPVIWSDLRWCMSQILGIRNRAEHLAERKRLYLLKHPETRRGTAGASAKHGSANEMISFAADSAQKTGRTERAVQQDVQIAESIPEDVRDAIRETPLAEKDEIELEENLQRKDLSPHEQSKTVVRLAETAAEVLKEQAEFRAESTRNRPGRPKEPGSLRDVAERTGIPEATIRAAQKHVETAEAMPVFTAPDVKQYHVLEARETPERSNRQIAGGLGVDHKTVGTVRTDLELSGEISQIAERVVERNGQTYTQQTANIGRSPSPRPVADPDFHDDDAGGVVNLSTSTDALGRQHPPTVPTRTRRRSPAQPRLRTGPGSGVLRPTFVTEESGPELSSLYGPLWGSQGPAPF